MPRGVGVRVPLSAQARHFFECRVFAYKGTRTDCGGSAIVCGEHIATQPQKANG